MTGGYLMLDFKNAELTLEGQKIDGITYDLIVNTNKPIVLTNLKKVDFVTMGLNTFTISRIGTQAIYLFAGTYGENIYLISIDKENQIKVVTIGSDTSSLKSEVNTNAGNTDK